MPQLDISFPLTNPVLIFALELFIILFGPVILRRIRIPDVIGLIVAGMLIGPHGFNLMLRDSSIVLFGTVGMLYIISCFSPPSRWTSPTSNATRGRAFSSAWLHS